MTTQPDFFADLHGSLQVVRYPAAPGFKAPGTSAEAALAMRGRAKTLRDAVEAVLARHDASADEVADELGESVLAIRPRCSELLRLGKIEAADCRRRNQSGKWAQVWRRTK